MSIFFPTLSALFFRRPIHPTKSTKKIRLDILIPAHNESDSIATTLKSIFENRSQFEGKILVAADACQDDTAQKAGANGAEVESVNFKSKWNSLNHLVKKSNADWIGLVDCGALWPADLLEGMNAYWENPKILGLAPSYLPSKAGMLTRIFWQFEKKLKSLESLSLGPVSVHGATVFYRRKNLVDALAVLESQNWLNDDVAIPTAIHFALDGHIVYLEKGISDIGHLKAANEFVRRQRMTLGNIQWIRLLLPQLRKKNIITYLIAQRRLFRVFWIYWLGMLFLGASNYGIIPLLFLLLFFRQSAIASLLAPYLLLRFKINEQARWS